MKVYNEITLSNRNFEFWGSAKENAEREKESQTTKAKKYD